MADHQRVHPVQEAAAAETPSKPTAPLVPRGSSRSENGDPERQDHFQPPNLRRTKPPKKQRSCCKKCFCWSICLLFLLILLIGILAAIFYFVFKPKIPQYSVDSMQITQFNLGADNSLSATFNVNITARNPNEKIGIYYESGSRLSVWYTETILCQGSLPVFYQGHRNTTVLGLTLAGETADAAGLIQSLRAQQQAEGNIPLNFRARVPVRLRMGTLKLMKWKFLVRCRVSVNNLAQNNFITISDSSCRFRFRL